MLETRERSANELKNILQKAESYYADLSKAGKEFNMATTMLCGKDSAQLRAVLLGGQLGDSATVAEMWEGRMKADPVCQAHLAFINDDKGGRIVPLVASADLAKDGKNFVWENMLHDFQEVLSEFCDDDRVRFQRDNKVNEGLVMALNGVKPNELEFMSQLGLSHQISRQQMKRMVGWCISRSKKQHPNIWANKKVTAVEACSAHKIFVVGKSDMDSYKFDLRSETEDFGQCLPQLCLEAMSNIGWKNLPGEKWEPIVEVHTVTSSGDGDISPFQVSVVHECFPKSFMSAVIEGMNELKYLIGTGGKKEARLRSASITTNPAPFTVGKAVYAGVDAAEVEQKLLAVANTICEGQRTFVEGKQKRNGGYVVTFAANQLLTVVANLRKALFSSHSDYSARLCSPHGSPRHEVEQEKYLPHRPDLQVITFVFSNSPIEYSTTLVYYNSNQTELKKVPLSNCCLHHQGPGSQVGGILHGVVPNTENGAWDLEDTIWRVSVTCRYAVDPVLDEAIFNEQMKQELGGYVPLVSNYRGNYNQVRVFDILASDQVLMERDQVKMESSEHTTIPDHDTTQGIKREITQDAILQGSISRVSLMSCENSDTIPNISLEKFEERQTFRCDQSLEFCGQISELVTSYRTTKDLFDRRILIQIKESESSPAVPILHTVMKQSESPSVSTSAASESRNLRGFPVPGEVYELHNICVKAGVYHDTRANPIFSNNPAHPKIMILSRLYKNDWASCLAFRHRLDEWVKDRSQPFITDEFSGELMVCGSGGSPERAGDVVTNYSRDRKDNASVKVPISQNFDSKINVGLQMLAKQQQVVGVYVREDVMFATDQDADAGIQQTSKCRFWGMFACAEMMIRTEEEEDVMKELLLAKASKAVVHLSRFRLVPHIVLKLKFLFNHEQLQRTRLEDPARLYKTLTVQRHYDNRKLRIAFQTGEQSAVMGMGETGITHRDIGQLFVDNGGESLYQQRTLGTEDDDEVEDDEEAPESLIKVHCEVSSATYEQAVVCVMLVNYAGASRWLGGSLTEPSDLPHSKAKQLNDWRIPVGIDNHPHPMGTRLLDVNTLFLHQVARESTVFERTQTNLVGARIAYSDEVRNDIIELMFQATLLRFTGRVKHFRTYSRLTGCHPMIPLRKNLHMFLSFMESTVDQLNDQSASIGQWLSSQHKNCIPKYTRTLFGFTCFATRLANDLEETYDGMRKTATRSDAVVHLKRLFLSLTEDKKPNNIHWMAQQVVADVDEIFDDVFGYPSAEGIVHGYGAQVGHGIIARATGNPTMKEGLDGIVQIVQCCSRTPPEYLDMLGLERISNGGGVVHKLNGRPFNPTDAEEVKCRVYTVTKMTYRAYSNSPRPRLAKPFCHPIRLHEFDATNPVLDMHTLTVMNGIVDNMLKCTNQKTPMECAQIIIPECCLRPGEADWREASNGWVTTEAAK